MARARPQKPKVSSFRSGNHIAPGKIKDEKKGEQNECKSVKNPEQEQMIDRDLTGFLGLIHKHDVWKEIKATKAEVKKLEKEVARHRRKAQGGRNL